MKIVVDFIEHQAQRYDTLGDWFVDRSPTGQDFLHINVSHLGDKISELAIAIHEITEAVICMEQGVTAEMVDQYDFGFAEAQKAGLINKDVEPGDQPDAPYHDQHQLATRMEKEFLHACGVTWGDHEMVCAKVFQQ